MNRVKGTVTMSLLQNLEMALLIMNRIYFTSKSALKTKKQNPRKYSTVLYSLNKHKFKQRVFRFLLLQSSYFTVNTSKNNTSKSLR